MYLWACKVNIDYMATSQNLAIILDCHAASIFVFCGEMISATLSGHARLNSQRNYTYHMNHVPITFSGSGELYTRFFFFLVVLLLFFFFSFLRFFWSQ